MVDNLTVQQIGNKDVEQNKKQPIYKKPFFEILREASVFSVPVVNVPPSNNSIFGVSGSYNTGAGRT